MVEQTNIGDPPLTDAENAIAKNTAGVTQPEDAKAWEDEFRQLHLKVRGEEFVDLRVVRVFPVSSRADHVSFIDSKGKEIALVAHPHKMDKVSRQAIDRALERMYYVPKIVRMLAVVESFGMSRWEVMTDRGYAAFEITDREGIRKLPGGRYLIHDPDGNRYEIEDLARLDAPSRAMLQSEL